MCNGFSTRAGLGGSVAVLHPTPNNPSFDPSVERLQLLFSNQNEEETTQVNFKGWEALEGMRQPLSWVVVFRDGELSTSSRKVNANTIRSDVLLSFSIESDPSSVTQLDRRLDLGVGDDGIIGRRVSLLISSTEGPLAIAEGIIGWN
ncbi:hypothetical protein K504DRAFT_449003 [Pleomassaria siparia CBS 279.74]|uniref:Uncharacterized protein n=1 Tax=Pleomassaria siparia CBS 279.74 TaxID=1314801 RepID=A0A6G1JXE1_9PLEO|nr:hypothetical protein K504DRAFT_449003 [Pleomassaria siparia CBS 279.74]